MRGLQKESLKLGEVGSWGFRKAVISKKCELKQKVLIQKPQMSYPEELTKIKQGGYQFFYVFFWKKTPARTFVVTEEKSVLDFKKPNWYSCLGLSLVTWNWSHCSFPILKLWALKKYANLLCLCSLSGTTKSRWQHICLQRGLMNSLSPLLRPIAQKKKKDGCLMETCSARCCRKIQTNFLAN